LVSYTLQEGGPPRASLRVVHHYYWKLSPKVFLTLLWKLHDLNY